MLRTARRKRNAIVAASAFALSGSVAAACPPEQVCALSDAVAQTGPKWALGAADAMDSIVNAGSATGDIATVIANLETLTTPQQLSAAAAQMVPVMIGQGVQQANLTLDDLSSLVVSRMDSIRDRETRFGPHDQNLWVRKFGTSAQQQKDGQYPQYDVDSAGYAAGYDIDVGNWNVGAAYASAHPNVRSHSPLIKDQMNIDSRLFGFYAERLEGDTYVDLWAVVGRNSNDGARRIVFADIDRLAIGEYDTTYARLTGTLGRVYRFGEKLTLTPTLNLGYTYARDASYTEKGAGDLNLQVDDNVSESFIAGIDGRVAYALTPATTLTAHAGAGYRSFTDDASLNAAFVGGGPTFETGGASIEPYLVRAGVGAEYDATERIGVQANYEFEYRGRFQDNLWAATLRYRI